MSALKHETYRIAITAGEPAGIGPDLVAKLAQAPSVVERVIIGDPRLLTARAKQLNLKLKINTCDLTKPAQAQHAGELSVLEVSLASNCIPGQLDTANVPYVLKTLTIAGEGCMRNDWRAIVTGPVHKGIINTAGISFAGHTEFFAALANVSHVVMMLVAKNLRVALVTTHLPLAAVSQAITPSLLSQTIEILNKDLQQRFGIANPRIIVAGLNPHAGEGGYLGREEIDIINPVLERYCKLGIDLMGPMPADTIFLPKNLQHADAIMAMYHDQGLPVLKFYGFNEAVNITLGLPFIRTSVDHGTALELAGTNAMDVGSMQAALVLAIQLADKLSTG